MAIYLSDENGKLKCYAGNKLPTGYAGLVTQVNNMKAEQDNKIEKVDVIYDMNGGSTLDLRYPGGIVSNVPVNIGEVKKYKYLNIYFINFNYATDNIGGTSNVCKMNLNNELNGVYFADCVTSLFANSNIQDLSLFYNRFQYNDISNTICYYAFFANNLQTSDNYYITKIEGVY